MSKIRLAIVGCGGMGNRHFGGFVELTRAGLSDFELVAVCDPVREKAEGLAQNAEEELGKKPAVAERLEELEAVGVQAIDVVSIPWSHHTVAIEALQRGWHVMVEKPMGVTVRACKRIMEAADSSKGVLSVAENNHFSPTNLVGRELLRTGAVGTPRSILQHSIGGGSVISHSTPWRYYRRAGGPLLDFGVHDTYIIEYLMGDVDSVYAQARLHEKVRSGKAGAEDIQPDAEDAAYATFLFSNGAIGQYIEDHGGHGKGLNQRVVYGSKGSLHFSGDRSGKPVILRADGQGTIDDERILDLIPEFRLPEAVAALFGGERLWHFECSSRETDRKLLAVEYADFAESILKGKSPEVDTHLAARSVGLTYAMLESSRLGRHVTMEEVMKEEVSTYQDEVNEMLGLAG